LVGRVALGAEPPSVVAAIFWRPRILKERLSRVVGSTALASAPVSSTRRT